MNSALPVLSLLLAASCNWPSQQGQEVPLQVWDREENAIWLRRRWLHEARSDAEVIELARALKVRGMTRAYPFIGPPGADGRLGWRDGDEIRPYDESTARQFFVRFKAASTDVAVLPWTGGVLGRDVQLDNPGFKDTFVSEARALVGLGADGVHLNIEPMASHAVGYLELLRSLKDAISPAIVSVAAYPPSTPLHPYEDVHWTLPFLAEVCDAADEVTVMAYDTALTNGTAYMGLMEQWTMEIAATMRGRRCRWWMGLPAYEDVAPWHDPKAESLENSLIGLRRGLAREAVDARFAGVALYASWTLDQEEWATYDRLWRGLPGAGSPTIDLEVAGATRPAEE